MPELGVSEEMLTPLADGKEKQAFIITDRPEKVLLRWKDEKYKGPEFAISVYYLQKIFHMLRPDNFIDIDYPDNGGIVVDKVPSTPDFQKAVDIQQRVYVPNEGEVGNDDWCKAKQKEMSETGEYQEVAKLIEKLMVPNDNDWGTIELAKPGNSTFIDGHPMIVDIFNPINEGMIEGVYPLRRASLKIDVLKGVVEEYVIQGRITTQQAEQINSFSERYQQNVLKLIDNLSGKNAIAPDMGYTTLAELPADLAETVAPW